jgi:hypothetical protein
MSLVGATGASLAGAWTSGFAAPATNSEARGGDGRPSRCYCTLTTVMTGDIMKRLLPVS